MYVDEMNQSRVMYNASTVTASRCVTVGFKKFKRHQHTTHVWRYNASATLQAQSAISTHAEVLVRARTRVFTPSHTHVHINI